MALPMPTDVSPVLRRIITSFRPVCASNADCGAGKACYPYYYQWDDSYSKDDYDNGVVCMEEETEKCADPNNMFAVVNADYATTGEEYKITYKCSIGA